MHRRELHRTPACALVAASLLAVGAQAAQAASDPVRPAGRSGALQNERLSDSRVLTRWAHATRTAAVYQHPSGSAKRVARLHFVTEDDYREVYVALRSYVDKYGRTWVKVRVPRRPNGTRGWVTRDSLSTLRVVRDRLIINRRTLRTTLYRKGKRIFSARIGVGKSRTPTPKGHYWVREKFRVGGRGSLYGPYAIGTSAYSVLSDWPGGGVVGLHGTDQPGLIPGRPSHGCVRLRNADITRLYRRIQVGTPIWIR